jgi:hypothetical protein
MKRNALLLLLILVTLNLFAKTNGDKVDPLIENKFRQEFGSSVNVSWKIIDDVSIAMFAEDGQEKEIYYSSEGEIIGFGKTISKDLLPVRISQAIHVKFNSSVIQKIYEYKSQVSPTSYFIRLVSPRFSFVITANEFEEITIIKKEKSK